MDDDLEDFFAKKDKSKKKSKGSKSKFVAAELLPSTPSPPPPASGDQITEEGVIPDEPAATESIIKDKKKKDKDGTGSSNLNKDEDEWNVVDEIDYSGLKITAKNITKEAEEDQAESAESEPEYDEDGQVIAKREDSQGVWKLPSQSATAEVAPPPKAPVMEVVDLPNTKEGRYIPPSMRGGGSDSLTPVNIKKLKASKKKAPNIASTDDFPTLGAALPPSDYDSSSFEKVKGGGRTDSSATSHSGSARLETSNMYSALQH